MICYFPCNDARVNKSTVRLLLFPYLRIVAPLCIKISLEWKNYTNKPPSRDN